MRPEDIVGAVLRGVLTSGGKPSAKTLRRLSHGQLLSTRNIVTAAAAAWGLYEAMQSGTGGVAGPVGSGPRPQPAPSSHVPPPTPSSLPIPQAGPAAKPAPMPPPLPVPVAPPAPLAAAEDGGFPPDLARAIRVLIAAARADGDLKPEEGALIARQAAAGGAEELVRAELLMRRSLAEIVSGVGAPAVAAELYGLAFTVLRADEDVNSDERAWLAELERVLKLDSPTARRIEEEVAGRIDGTSS